MVQSIHDEAQPVHGEIRVCITCGEAFVIDESEARFFLGKGLELPKRCPACRAIKRVQKERMAAVIAQIRGIR